MMRDISILFRLQVYFPAVFMPIATTTQNLRTHATWLNLRDSMIHITLFLLEVLMLTTVIPAFTILPGIAFVSVTAACCGMIYVVSMPIRGPRTVKSSLDSTTLSHVGQFEDERWLFINGIASR
jgi:hypothetical protein